MDTAGVLRGVAVTPDGRAAGQSCLWTSGSGGMLRAGCWNSRRHEHRGAVLSARMAAGGKNIRSSC